MPAVAVIPAPLAYIKIVAVKETRSWISAEDSRSALADEYLNGHLFRRLHLHCIVWSGTRNLYFEEISVSQACAVREYISMQ